MNQSYENDFIMKSRPNQPLSTHDEGTSFTVNVVVTSFITQITEQESKKIITLGIPDNESFDIAERDLDQLTQNSLKDWND